MNRCRAIASALKGFIKRGAYLGRATAWAALLGVIEMVSSERGRRVLALLTVVAVGVGVWTTQPIRTIAPGEVGVRTNRLTGHVGRIGEGWALVLPAVHDLRRFPLRDQFYRPTRSARADGEAPFQTVEGLSIGVEVAVRYALDPSRIAAVAEEVAPSEIGRELVEPTVDGILHRELAQRTVREIFSTKRGEIQHSVEEQLRPVLLADGIVVRSVSIGNVDLPAQYRTGMDALLNEELAAEKMRYTLELKEKQVLESGLVGQADKVRREKAAEASGMEEIIAAKSREEAMQHVLPFKQKEIEQKRLEAEAAKITRLTLAEGEAQARRIEAGGEADSRRKLAEAEAYRIDQTGRAQSAQMERDAVLISKNPLLIQKTLADKLSDKIQVIIAPPQAGGFFAGGLLGQQAMARAATPVTDKSADTSSSTPSEGGE